jgi:hypothetical protein
MVGREGALDALAGLVLLPLVVTNDADDEDAAGRDQAHLEVCHAACASCSEIRGGLHVHRHDARYALLLHRHTDQLVGHLHRNLVVRDEEELGMVGHALDHAAEALGIGVVQGRVDLVEQAERRRVQAEHREHQRRRGQSLLAAGQQVDGRVLLARRLGHHLHAGVEDFVAGHHEPGLAAAEQDREQFREMLLTRSKVSCSRSRDSRSMRRIAPSSVAIASCRSAFCASRKRLRSAAWPVPRPPPG